jgi:DNA-binding transcriptional LysR family regulator
MLALIARHAARVEQLRLRPQVRRTGGGCLVGSQRVLPELTQPANVWAVFPERLAQSAKVKVCVDFLTEAFAQAGIGGASQLLSQGASSDADLPVR